MGDGVFVVVGPYAGKAGIEIEDFSDGSDEDVEEFGAVGPGGCG